MPVGERYQVYTVGKNDTAHMQWVTPGQRHDGQIEILDGLRLGQEAVVRGVQKLTDGAKIKRADTPKPGLHKAKAPPPNEHQTP